MRTLQLDRTEDCSTWNKTHRAPRQKQRDHAGSAPRQSQKTLLLRAQVGRPSRPPTTVLITIIEVSV